jgi:hypothetical protein
MKRFAFLAGVTALTSFGQSLDIDVGGDRQFTETALDVKAGDTLRFTASGSLQFLSPPRQTGPDGIPRGWSDVVKTYPVINGQKAALIGRIGDRETSRAFEIGSSAEKKVGVDGKLFLGVNILSSDKVDGVFHVHVERIPGALADRDGIRRSLPRLSQYQLESVPPRVQDKVGNAGDRVNFFVIGSEEQVKLALQQGGWTKVDRNKKEAVVEGLLNSLSKQAYVSMPMSELYLFDRVQDYGFAMGDPLKVVEQRHHFRIWRAPFTVGGRTAWAGAGTHDIGFDRDRRAGGLVTHKIDPDTDKERDFITASFTESGLVAFTEYMTMRNTITNAKTATGEEFKSDGRTVIIYLIPEQQ